MALKGLTDMKPLPDEFIVSVRCEHFVGNRYLAWPKTFTTEVTADAERARTFADLEEVTRAMDHLVSTYSDLNIAVKAEVLRRTVVRLNGHWEPATVNVGSRD